jgi:hypothetical protein
MATAGALEDRKLMAQESQFEALLEFERLAELMKTARE